MKLSFSLRPWAVALLLTCLVSACNTGTDTGATNVERGTEKSLDPASRQNATLAADSAAAGLSRDTASGPTTRQQYEQAGETTDRDHDGLAD